MEKQYYTVREIILGLREEYIKNQIQEDLAYEQLSLKEYVDPFTGDKYKKA